MPQQLGTLVVVALKARNLPNPSLYKQDPYCAIHFDGKEYATSADIKGGQHPVWDQEFHLPIYATHLQNGEKALLKVTCSAKERRDDTFLGEATLSVGECFTTGEFDDWVQLSNNNIKRGEIYLEMTFFANAPASLSRRPSKLSPNERLARPGYSHALLSPPNSSTNSPAASRNTSPIPPALHLPSIKTPPPPPLKTNLDSSSLPPPSLRPASVTTAASLSGARLSSVPTILRPGSAIGRKSPSSLNTPLLPPLPPKADFDSPIAPNRIDDFSFVSPAIKDRYLSPSMPPVATPLPPPVPPLPVGYGSQADLVPGPSSNEVHSTPLLNNDAEIASRMVQEEDEREQEEIARRRQQEKEDEALARRMMWEEEEAVNNPNLVETERSPSREEHERVLPGGWM